MAKIYTGVDVKSQFKQLSEAAIQASTDDASFRKGQDYYHNHAIVEPTLSESVLRALCHSSSGNSYHVEATLLTAGEKVLTGWLPLTVVAHGEASASMWWPCCSPGSISQNTL